NQCWNELTRWSNNTPTGNNCLHEIQQEAVRPLTSLSSTGISGRLHIPTAQCCYIGRVPVGYTATELCFVVGTMYQHIYLIPLHQMNISKGELSTGTKIITAICTNSSSIAKDTVNI
ncbi:MAG: hypothetical protein ACKPKO_24005, partial [Candidatus Fonsibacter sp.]